MHICAFETATRGRVRGRRAPGGDACPPLTEIIPLRGEAAADFSRPPVVSMVPRQVGQRHPAPRRLEAGSLQ